MNETMRRLLCTLALTSLLTSALVTTCLCPTALADDHCRAPEAKQCCCSKPDPRQALLAPTHGDPDARMLAAPPLIRPWGAPLRSDLSAFAPPTPPLALARSTILRL
jgi:hypothetical protein